MNHPWTRVEWCCPGSSTAISSTAVLSALGLSVPVSSILYENSIFTGRYCSFAKMRSQIT